MIALGFIIVIGLPVAVLLWAVFWPQPSRSGDGTAEAGSHRIENNVTR